MTVNDGWKTDLLKKIKEFLKEVTVDNGMPDYGENLKKLKKCEEQILNKFSEYFDESTVFYHFHVHLIDALQTDKEFSGKLEELLSESDLNEIAEEIVQFFSSFPRKYYVFFSLPGFEDITVNLKELLPGFDIVRINEDAEGIRSKYISLSYYNTMRQLALGIEGNGGLPPGTYLRIELEGYGEGLNSQVVLQSFDALKQLIYILHLTKAVELLPSYKKASEAGAVIFDLSQPDYEPKGKRLEIPQMIRSFLGRVKWKEVKEVGPFMRGYIKEPLNYILLDEAHKNVLNLATRDPNVLPIKNSLIWAFDARLNADEIKIAFFKLAVALEAILGVNSDRNGKTSQLGDRLAYLAGGNFEHRKEIKDKFEEFYNIRSDLIHRGIVGKQAKELFDWGLYVLDFVLKKESYRSAK